jgi:hypothetical protein
LEVNHRPWWTEFIASQRLLQEANPKKDFLLPKPLASLEGFTDRPISNAQALRWLRDLISQGYLRRKATIPDGRLNEIRLPALRVMVPDLMYKLGIPADVRQNLGRWASLSTTDVYTRDHRAAITRAWTIMVDAIKDGKSIPMDGAPAPLQRHSATQEERGHRQTRGARKRARAPTPEKEDLTITEVIPGPQPAIEEENFLLEPRLIMNVASKNLHWTEDLNIGLGGTGIGCGWEYRINQVTSINMPSELKSFQHPCTWCFRKFTFPSTWEEDDIPSFTGEGLKSSSDDDSSSSSESSSEEEEVAPSTTTQVGGSSGSAGA